MEELGYVCFMLILLVEATPNIFYCNNFTQFTKLFVNIAIKPPAEPVKSIKTTVKHTFLLKKSVTVVSYEYLFSEERLSQLHKGNSGRLSRYWSTF